MATVLSNYSYTFADTNGDPRIHAWLLLEFRSTGYVPGGEAVDLSAYMRHAVAALYGPVSGALAYKVFELNQADTSGWPGGITSSRTIIQTQIGSGQVMSELVSGTAISGTRAFMQVLGY